MVLCSAFLSSMKYFCINHLVIIGLVITALNKIYNEVLLKINKLMNIVHPTFGLNKGKLVNKVGEIV